MLSEEKRPPKALYALPIVLGLVGSLIGWLAVRRKDHQMGRKLWVIGSISSAIWGVIYVVLLPLFLLVGATQPELEDSAKPARLFTCKEEIASPFTLVLPENGQPQVISSEVILQGEPETLLCGGLKVDVRASESDSDQVILIIEIQNEDNLPWQGTARLTLENHPPVPVAIRRVPAMMTLRDQIELSVDRGATQQITLLIGP